ncbi:hypothetical protein GW755_03030 [bacterium]|nr:hypothetical protein [bacterium]
MLTKDKEIQLVQNKTKVKKRLTLFMDPLLIKHARAQAVLEETSLTVLVRKALLAYLPKQTIIKKVEL